MSRRYTRTFAAPIMQAAATRPRLTAVQGAATGPRCRRGDHSPAVGPARSPANPPARAPGTPGPALTVRSGRCGEAPGRPSKQHGLACARL